MSETQLAELRAWRRAIHARRTKHHPIRALFAGLLVVAIGWLVIRAIDRACSRAHAAELTPIAIDAGGPSNHSEVIAVDLPTDQHLRNKSGRDGLGLCVFTSLDHAARYQNCQALIGFRDFMTKYPGGGWPEKVSQYIPRMAASKGLPVPDYVQHTGGDVEFLKLALKTGRMVCVTYNGRDGVYYRGPIAHMVNLVHLSDRWAVILDNNNPGKYLWMTPAEFLARWRGSGGGWAIALLAPPPPPVPVSGG